MTEAIQLRECLNETKKAAKRALFKADINKQGVLPTEAFFKILEENQIMLTQKNKSQSIHDFEDHNNGQIRYLDALRYIQAHDSNWETQEVTKGTKDKSKSRNTEDNPMATTNFTTLVYGSPVRRLYNTSTVTSPNQDDYIDEYNMPSGN